MKRLSSALVILLAASFFFACEKKTVEEPCDGKGTLNIENKLDSTITVTIAQTKKTESLERDYTRPFTLTGNQPYTFTIDGPDYHMDCTMMILPCDNKLLLIQK